MCLCNCYEMVGWITHK